MAAAGQRTPMPDRSERFLLPGRDGVCAMRRKRPRASPRSRKLIKDAMPMHGHADPTPARLPLAGGDEGSLKDDEGSLRDVERAYVQRVLAKSGTLGEAARRLGIDMTTLWRMPKRWGLAYHQ